MTGVYSRANGREVEYYEFSVGTGAVVGMAIDHPVPGRAEALVGGDRIARGFCPISQAHTRSVSHSEQRI
jgi:hypothetical protein